MADYKRMISYMYQYVKGEKTKNVGYARIELRNGYLKITIHLQLQGYVDGIFPTYLIQRDDDNLELVYYGDSTLKNQIIDSKLGSSETNIMDSGYNFSDIGGILLFLNEEVFFATEWDDRPVVLRDVMEALMPKDKKAQIKDKEAVTEIKTELKEEAKVESEVASKVAEITLEQSSRTDKSEKSEEKIEKPEQSDRQERSDRLEGLDQSEKPERSEKSEGKSTKKSVEESTKQVEANIQYSDLRRAPMAWNRVWPYKAPKAMELHNSESDPNIPIYQLPKRPILGETDVVKQPEPIKAAGVLQGKGIKPSTEDKNTEKKDHRSKDSEYIENQIAEYMFKNYQRIYPFEDNEIIISVKIEPKDIGYFPKEVWTLSGNSFLLHGYYCYNHLIFAKMKGRSGYQYILGVPGIYHNKEMYMAKMFGFYNFKSIRKRDLRQGDFGYWYVTVNM